MQYYMLPWRQVTGVEGPYFEPHATLGAAQWSAIDLRPDPSAGVGWCFVGSDRPLSGLPANALDLGVDPASLTGKQRNTIAANLGLASMGAATLRDALVELLIDRAGEGGWAALKPRQHGPNQWEIWLGGQLTYAVPRVQGGAIYTESFNKIDGDLGPDLTWNETTGGSLQVLNNQLTQTSGQAVRHRARAEHDAASTSQFAQVTVHHLTASQYGDIVLCLCWDAASTNTHYGATIFQDNGAGYKWELRKWVAGTESKLTGKTAFTFATGQVFRAEYDGSTMTFFFNGVTLGSHTDTSVTGLRGGYSTYRQDANNYAIVDDFSFGDLGGADPIPAGTATGVWGFTGAATGAAPPGTPAGAAAGSWGFTGLASGAAPVFAAPTGLTATVISETQIDLTWNASSGAAGYDLERDGTVITSDVVGTSHSDTGLTPGTSYTYRVRAVAAASEPNPDLRDPNLARIAYTCDGNAHDEDDWGASAVGWALLSKEYLHNVVHWEYRNHFWFSEGTDTATWDAESHESNAGGATNFGFPAGIVYDCMADGAGTYAVAARDHLVEQINASTATDRLILICAGPMETAWQALNAADPTARTYVDCISHSLWNDDHAGVDGHFGHTHNGHNWADLGTLGANLIHIKDQNGDNGGVEPTTMLGNQPTTNFAYFRDAADTKWHWVYPRLEAVTMLEADAGSTTDCSDAGMVYYVVTGMTDQDTTATKIRTYLGL